MSSSAVVMSCRLCNRRGSHSVVALHGMPRWNHRLLPAAEVSTDGPVDLEVHRCEGCGFVSVASLLGGDYYSDYVNAPSASPQMRKFLKSQAVEFVSRFNLAGKRIIEVGCGDGGFLAELREAGAVCLGIEPSDAQRELARDRNLSVEGGTLTADRVLEGAPFDAFATRQVFEHIEDLYGFLYAIRRQLKPGGFGLVEVPNLDTLLASDRFFDFIPEHVNYFSTSTLRLVLELGGFEVLAIDSVQDGEALRALVRNRADVSLEGLTRRMMRLRREITEFVRLHKRDGAQVVVWGAGGKGLSILATCGLTEKDVTVVDGDRHKHGRYTPVSHLAVHSPDVLSERGEVAAVVIMAPAYRREILETLRGQYAFKGAVGVVSDTFEVLEATEPGAGEVVA